MSQKTKIDVESPRKSFREQFENPEENSFKKRTICGGGVLLVICIVTASIAVILLQRVSCDRFLRRTHACRHLANPDAPSFYGGRTSQPQLLYFTIRTRTFCILQ
jgi:hypothetical protein